MRIISGGQTGVDRAALDVAAEVGLEGGGWCPRGRLAEDGPLDPRYSLRETPSQDYAQRTTWNVRDSDATLVLAVGPPQGGTAFTCEEARRLSRRLLVVDLASEADPKDVRSWLGAQPIEVLNVAGPRESGSPGIYALARSFLLQVLDPPGVPDPGAP